MLYGSISHVEGSRRGFRVRGGLVIMFDVFC